MRMLVKIFLSSHNKQTAVDSEQCNVQNTKIRNRKLDRMIKRIR
jgi:hypothetical protein